MDPGSTYNPQGDTNCYLYDFHIDPTIAFVQEGSTANPVVYWLEVQARPAVGTTSAKFGWKTSFSNWNDAATWAAGAAPYAGAAWTPLVYPANHPRGGNAIGLSFRITTSQQFAGVK